MADFDLPSPGGFWVPVAQMAAIGSFRLIISRTMAVFSSVDQVFRFMPLFSFPVA